MRFYKAGVLRKSVFFRLVVESKGRWGIADFQAEECKQRHRRKHMWKPASSQWWMQGEKRKLWPDLEGSSPSSIRWENRDVLWNEVVEMRSHMPERWKFAYQVLGCLAFLPRASYLISLSLIPHLCNRNTIHPHRIAMEIKWNNAFKALRIVSDSEKVSRKYLLIEWKVETTEFGE